MNLVLDQGNTMTKVAIYDGSEVVDKAMFSAGMDKEVLNWISHKKSLKSGILSSVVSEKLEVEGVDMLEFDYRTPLPIDVKYLTPSTLGLDRLANAVGAWFSNPDNNSIVIDMGTCIKYDIVNFEGEYVGGNISPGLQMRYKALGEMTDALPRLRYSDKRNSHGIDTESSIIEGVQQGIEHEIRGFVARYSNEYPDLTIFMTGGDIKYFDLEFKNSIFAVPDLTLFGLNEILKYNARK